MYVVFGLFWFCWFLWFFYSVTPQNNPEIGRWDVWRSVPVILLQAVDPVVEPRDPRSGWRYFPQRIPILAAGALILAGAWAVGSLLLRMLRILTFRDRVERFVVVMGVGLSALSLMTLGAGVVGMLDRRLAVSVLVAAIVAQLMLLGSRSAGKRFEGSPTGESHRGWRVHAGANALFLLIAAPFAITLLFGAMSPPQDFDVREYHLAGPKEFFLLGRVEFLPHNCYTSFPFLSEMLSLLGMVVYGSWLDGALVGKVVLMAFAPLTSLAVYCVTHRSFGPAAARLAALIHFTTPWVYRISIIAYAEGAISFYLICTVLAGLQVVQSRRNGGRSVGDVLLLGFMAGSAMAAKYPGLLSVVLPAAVAIFCAERSREHSAIARGRDTTDSAAFDARHDGEAAVIPAREGHFRAVAIAVLVYGLGVSVAIGPWLLKNLVETGNPVYPLAWSVFGGEDWDAALDAKWRAGHRPPGHQLEDLGKEFLNVVARTNWHSPLLFGLAPLGLLWWRHSRVAVLLWVYVVYLFLFWWTLTNRIDRFWVPMIPVVAVLAGAGAEWNHSRIWRYGRNVLCAVALLFNLAVFHAPVISGYNARLTELSAARELVASSGVGRLNRILPEGSRVLSVGDAELYEAEFDVIYNTVFDHSIFEEWFGVSDGSTPSAAKPLRPAAEILRRLADEGVTHVYVYWSEILRYRDRYSYGYTDFVTPARFRDLVRDGVLCYAPFGDPLLVVRWSDVSEDTRKLIDKWAPELRVERGGAIFLIAAELFEVL